MPEPRLQTLPSGNLKIGAEHFRKVVRRIECIKPIAGDNITLTPTEDGIKISSTATAASQGVFQSSSFTVIGLNVCENGQPAVISVLAPLLTIDAES